MDRAHNSATQSHMHNLWFGLVRQTPVALMCIVLAASLAGIATASVRPIFAAVLTLTYAPLPAAIETGASPDVIQAETARFDAFAEAAAGALAHANTQAALPEPLCRTEVPWAFWPECGRARLALSNDPGELVITAHAPSAERAATLARAAGEAVVALVQSRERAAADAMRAPHLGAVDEARVALESYFAASPAALASARLGALDRIGESEDEELWQAAFGARRPAAGEEFVRSALQSEAAAPAEQGPAQPSAETESGIDVQERYWQAIERLLRAAPPARAAEVIVSPARGASSTVLPPLHVSLALGALAGFAAGVAIGLMRELSRRVVVRLNDVQARLGAPLLAPAPTVSAGELRLLDPALRNPAGAVTESPQSAIAAAMRAALANISHPDPSAHGGLAVAMIADRPGVGSSTLAAGLARMAAQAGRKTLLVDADIRAQGALKALGLETNREKAAVHEWRRLIVPDSQTRLDVLPLPARPGALPFAFPDVEFAGLVDMLRGEYELIVIDCPAALGRTDGLIAARAAGLVVLAAGWNKTDIDAAKAVRNHLARLSARAPDWVFLNRTNPLEANAWFRRAMQSPIDPALAARLMAS